MRIDNNSFYVRYTIHPQYGGQATATHYVEVGDNYYVIRTYGFDKHGINFEDASWTGVNTEDTGRETRILGRYYNRWEKRVNELKGRLTKMARQAAQPFHADVNPGDCILEIYEKDEELEYDYESFEFYKVRKSRMVKLSLNGRAYGLIILVYCNGMEYWKKKPKTLLTAFTPYLNLFLMRWSTHLQNSHGAL